MFWGFQWAIFSQSLYSVSKLIGCEKSHCNCNILLLMWCYTTATITITTTITGQVNKITDLMACYIANLTWWMCWLVTPRLNTCHSDHAQPSTLVLHPNPLHSVSCKFSEATDVTGFYCSFFMLSTFLVFLARAMASRCRLRLRMTEPQVSAPARAPAKPHTNTSCPANQTHTDNSDPQTIPQVTLALSKWRAEL